MRISFDIDDTLVVHSTDSPVETERVPTLFRRLYRERLRLGAAPLFYQLAKNGWEVCVYTPSDRSQTYLKKWLRFYGVRVELAVNADRHRQEVIPRFRDQRPPSKHPGLYGIDLHVDDSHGVAMEGRENCFRTIIIDPQDLEWTEKILAAADQVRAASECLPTKRVRARESVGIPRLFGVPGHLAS